MKSWRKAVVAGLGLQACLAAAAFSDADRALFDQAKGPSVPNEVATRASARATELGKEGDLAALDYLLASGNGNLLRRFANENPENATPFAASYEARVVANFDKPDIAPILLAPLRKVRSPELFERLYRDAAELARWRADRRKRCRVQVAGHAQGVDVGGYSSQAIIIRPAGSEKLRNATSSLGRTVQYRYVCGAGEPDANFDNPDALPSTGPRGVVRREYESLRTITRTDLPGVENRLGPLFANLALLPKEDWSEFKGEKPAGIRLVRTGQIPWNVLDFLGARGYKVDSAVLLEILEGYDSPDITRRHANDSRNRARQLLRLLMQVETRRNAQVLAHWIERFSSVEDPRERQDVMDGLIPLLGPLPPEAQVDVAALKKKVYENVPYAEVGRYAEVFKRVEDDNARKAQGEVGKKLMERAK